MKLILCEDVKNLGQAGAQVNVAEGYGRNFLLPKKLAVLASPQNLKRLEQQLNGKKGKELRVRKDAQQVADGIASQPMTFKSQAGEGGKLFGSVTAADIEAALAERGIDIDKRKIVLEEPIKMVGTYTVPIKLHQEITAQLTVLVQPQE